MNTDIFKSFQNINFLSLSIKVFGIIFALFYLVFSIVIIRQVQVMKRTIILDDYGLLLFFAFIQFVLAGILLLYGILII